MSLTNNESAGLLALASGVVPLSRYKCENCASGELPAPSRGSAPGSGEDDGGWVGGESD